ncbi:hypothetical protein ACFFPJ_06290 [Microbacterium terregens]|uniref:Uncharacterized protein n=2 Tax=Microbacterium terregens TaxID=69363 RepID=A0ABV5SYH1_9MICO
MQSATASRGLDYVGGRSRFARTGLMLTQAFVAVTALAGGSALIVAEPLPQTATVLSPPEDYLLGTPFTSYLVPGLLLAVVVGGVHTAAFLLNLTRSSWRVLGAATAGFALLIWIFVQMVFIPFSFLQAVYFVAGLAEIGLIMLALGITDPAAGESRSR